MLHKLTKRGRPQDPLSTSPIKNDRNIKFVHATTKSPRLARLTQKPLLSKDSLHYDTTSNMFLDELMRFRYNLQDALHKDGEKVLPSLPTSLSQIKHSSNAKDYSSNGMLLGSLSVQNHNVFQLITSDRNYAILLELFSNWKARTIAIELSDIHTALWSILKILLQQAPVVKNQVLESIYEQKLMRYTQIMNQVHQIVIDEIYNPYVIKQNSIAASHMPSLIEPPSGAYSTGLISSGSKLDIECVGQKDLGNCIPNSIRYLQLEHEMHKVTRSKEYMGVSPQNVGLFRQDTMELVLSYWRLPKPERLTFYSQLLGLSSKDEIDAMAKSLLDVCSLDIMKQFCKNCTNSASKPLDNSQLIDKLTSEQTSSTDGDQDTSVSISTHKSKNAQDFAVYDPQIQKFQELQQSISSVDNQLTDDSGAPKSYKINNNGHYHHSDHTNSIQLPSISQSHPMDEPVLTQMTPSSENEFNKLANTESIELKSDVPEHLKLNHNRRTAKVGAFNQIYEQLLLFLLQENVFDNAPAPVMDVAWTLLELMETSTKGQVGKQTIENFNKSVPGGHEVGGEVSGTIQRVCGVVNQQNVSVTSNDKLPGLGKLRAILTEGLTSDQQYVMKTDQLQSLLVSLREFQLHSLGADTITAIYRRIPMLEKLFADVINQTRNTIEVLPLQQSFDRADLSQIPIGKSAKTLSSNLKRNIAAKNVATQTSDDINQEQLAGTMKLVSDRFTQALDTQKQNGKNIKHVNTASENLLNNSVTENDMASHPLSQQASEGLQCKKSSQSSWSLPATKVQDWIPTMQTEIGLQNANLGSTNFSDYILQSTITLMGKLSDVIRRLTILTSAGSADNKAIISIVDILSGQLPTDFSSEEAVAKWIQSIMHKKNDFDKIKTLIEQFVTELRAMKELTGQQIDGGYGKRGISNRDADRNCEDKSTEIGESIAEEFQIERRKSDAQFIQNELKSIHQKVTHPKREKVVGGKHHNKMDTQEFDIKEKGRGGTSKLTYQGFQSNPKKKVRYIPVTILCRTLYILYKDYYDRIVAGALQYGARRMEFSEFMYDWHIRKYGLKALAQKHVIKLIRSMLKYTQKFIQCQLCLRFLGIQNGLGYHELKFTLSLIDKLSGGSFIGTTKQRLEFSQRDFTFKVRISYAVVCVQELLVDRFGEFLQPLDNLSAKLKGIAISNDDEFATEAQVLLIALDEWTSQKNYLQEIMETIYKAGDLNGDNCLELDEFTAVLTHLTPTMDSIYISRIFDAAHDIVKPRRMSLERFIDMILQEKILSSVNASLMSSTSSSTAKSNDKGTDIPKNEKQQQSDLPDLSYVAHVTSRRERVVIAKATLEHEEAYQFQMLEEAWETDKDVVAQVLNIITHQPTIAALKLRVAFLTQILSKRVDSTTAWMCHRQIMREVALYENRTDEQIVAIKAQDAKFQKAVNAVRRIQRLNNLFEITGKEVKNPIEMSNADPTNPIDHMTQPIVNSGIEPNKREVAGTLQLNVNISEQASSDNEAQSITVNTDLKLKVTSDSLWDRFRSYTKIVEMLKQQATPSAQTITQLEQQLREKFLEQIDEQSIEDYKNAVHELRTVSTQSVQETFINSPQLTIQNEVIPQEFNANDTRDSESPDTETSDESEDENTDDSNNET